LYDDKPVQSANLLCIHLTAKLNMSEHAEQTVSVCNQSIYVFMVSAEMAEFTS